MTVKEFTREKKYYWHGIGMENYLHDTWYSIWRKNGLGSADRSIAPLQWYVNTGRASTDFCKKLVEKKPYVIGRVLKKLENHPYSEVIEAIKKKINE